MKNEQNGNQTAAQTHEHEENLTAPISKGEEGEESANGRVGDVPGTSPLRTPALYGRKTHRPNLDEPWPEPVDGKSLLDALCRVLGRFVVLPRYAQEILALWTLHTYAFELRDITTYIGIESPEKRCGKTTLMTLLSELVNRPEAAANISSPAFFRTIEERHPTLLIDESDTHLKGNHQLRGILNSGYSRKMAYVLRVTSQQVQSPRSKVQSREAEAEGLTGGQVQSPRSNPLRRGDSAARVQSWEVEAEGLGETATGTMLARFSCWCPKAIATIGHLPETLADRCIRIRMQRKTAAESCERFNDEEAKAFEPLRRQCARFVRDHAAEIASARPSMPEGLNDRAVDIGEPLLVLSDLAGGDWPKIAREAMVGLAARAEESNPIGALLLDIFVLFVRLEADRLFTRTLVADLNRWRDRPWAEMFHGKEINDLLLARKLRPYGIRPKTIWIGEEHAKGYVQEECMDVFRRYIPKSEWEALKAEMLGKKPGDGDAKTEGEEQE